jgi:hypothetical protein
MCEVVVNLLFKKIAECRKWRVIFLVGAVELCSQPSSPTLLLRLMAELTHLKHALQKNHFKMVTLKGFEQSCMVPL